VSLPSWGNFPSVVSDIITMRSRKTAQKALQDKSPIVCYGNGRSYGDSALGTTQLDMRKHNKYIAFDPKSGLLEVQSGALIGDLLETFIPRMWNLPVVPGTKLITIGGAIAADVHGKNHHLKGCFSEAVVSLKLLLPNQQLVSCSSTENTELLHATCGGQGLTGVIISAKIQLEKITSHTLDVTTLKARNLEQAFSHFEQNSDSPYSVAWIDCCAQGAALGRSLVSLAKFSDQHDREYLTPRRLNIPFFFPKILLNRWTVQAFNALYYRHATKQKTKSQADIDRFFFPLDSLRNWNRIYGKSGFVQYQFILPLANSHLGIAEVLETIAQSKRASFLAVLKLHGAANENFLSFPLKGYSLALDFKITAGLFEFLDELDQLVLKHKGRIYLAKDARVPKSVFDAGYTRADEFRELRRKIGAADSIQSRQSQRLEL